MENYKDLGFKLHAYYTKKIQIAGKNTNKNKNKQDVKSKLIN